MHSHERKIVNGEPDLGGQFPSVVHVFGVRDDGTYREGTGVLIAPNVVLTAGHVLIPYRRAPERIGVFTHADFDAPAEEGVVVRARALHLPDDYLRGRFITTLDVGLIVLDEPIPPEVAQPMPMRQELLAEYMTDDLDVIATIVGGGASFDNDPTRIRRSGQLRISFVGHSVMIGHPVPDGPRQGTCRGSSGGAVILDDKLVGILSSLITIGPDCEGPNVMVRLDTLQDWIQSVVDDAPQGCGDCPCEEACMNDGAWCDESLCEAQGCREIFECALSCHSMRDPLYAYVTCITNCAATGFPESIDLYGPLQGALDSNECQQATNPDQLAACVQRANPLSYEACMADSIHPLPEEVDAGPEEPEPDMEGPEEPEPDTGWAPQLPDGGTTPVPNDSDAARGDGGIIILPPGDMSDLDGQGCDCDAGGGGSSPFAPLLCLLLLTGIVRMKR